MITVETTLEFDDWLMSLRDRKARARITDRIERLRFGNFGDVQSVGAGVSELRIYYGPGFRVYLVQQGKTWVVILCGGDKSTQSADIRRAKTLADELKA